MIRQNVKNLLNDHTCSNCMYGEVYVDSSITCWKNSDDYDYQNLNSDYSDCEYIPRSNTCALWEQDLHDSAKH